MPFLGVGAVVPKTKVPANAPSQAKARRRFIIVDVFDSIDFEKPEIFVPLFPETTNRTILKYTTLLPTTPRLKICQTLFFSIREALVVERF